MALPTFTRRMLEGFLDLTPKFVTKRHLWPLCPPRNRARKKRLGFMKDYFMLSWMHSWPPTGLFWPLVLCMALLAGMLISLFCLRADAIRERISPNPTALAEASIAICSGALLWIGYWDFIDTYLVPTEWWAKLCMFLVGALGALFTRSLYSDQTAPRHSIRSYEGTSAALDDGDDPPPLPDGPPPLVEVMSPRPRSFGQSEGESDVEVAAVRGTPGKTPGRAMTRPKKGARGVGGGGDDGPTLWSKMCFLNPPKFSVSRCGRALLATFSGLTMWVGLWDLIESHMLPALFSSCSHEPSTGCAMVKLSLVFIGAFGLYLTRSLYGDHGVGVQFQRL